MSDLDDRLDRVALLGDPVRRALYRFVAAQPGPVTREAAAAGVGVPHHVAKFQLDRMAEEGLLEIDYQRPPGRRGPGAGRPAKVFRLSAREVAASVPERRYDLAARLLAQAVEAAGTGTPIADALHASAVTAGRELGEAARSRAGRRPSRDAVLAACCRALDDWGFETRRAGGAVELANCPFHALAREHTALVCGMNRSLLAGVLAGADLTTLDAELDPDPARCCVRLVPG